MNNYFMGRKNKTQSNIEQNEEIIEKGQDDTIFDEEGYNSGLLEVSKEKVEQKNYDNSRADELINRLNNEESLSDNRQRLIIEITGEEDIDDEDLQLLLNELSEEELKKIKENKDLILEITGEISLSSLYYFGKYLSELAKEELEKIKKNKDLILNILGEIRVADLDSLSELTKEELEEIKGNKDLISEVTGFEYIDALHIKQLLGLTRDELETVKENKNLILEITGYETISENVLKELSELTKEELERIKENKNLILEITGDETISQFELKELNGLTREELERIKENKNLILEITGDETISPFELKELNGLTREELERIKENKDLILELLGEKHTYKPSIRKENLKQLAELTEKEFERIKKNKDLILELTGNKNIHIGNLKELSALTKEELESIKVLFNKNCEKIYISARDVLNINKIMKESNITTIRNYMERKQNYLKEKRRQNYLEEKNKQNNLEKNRLISNSEFRKFFGGVGKYGKFEINQEGLGCCYLYTVFEILKKKNFFETLIKTNLKIAGDGSGWYVKLPMGQLDGQRFKVSKNEIDKKFDIPNKERGLKKGVSINSDSSLGFKIMEIAYIKKDLIDRSEDINQEYLNTGNVALTGERLSAVERSSTESALRKLIGSDKVIKLYDANIGNNIDIVFDNFEKGLIVDLGVKSKLDPNDEVEIDLHGKKTIQAVEKDVKILSNDKNLIEKSNKDELGDVINKDGGQQAIFYRNHAYSLERCYIDKSTGEKRVWVVNPWHTGIKFDISLESAKKIFDRDVSYIDIDKLFR